MRKPSWVRSVSIVAFGLGSSVALAADGPSCRTFDRAPACCPHPAPVCCPAPVSAGIDDAAVRAICGESTPKGESAGNDSCKRYYTRNEVVNEVSFSRVAGDAAKFEKLRGSLAGARNRVSPIKVAGAASAFIVRELGDDGALERSSAWALTGSEVLTVEAERGACDDNQVVRLLAHALERVQAEASARKAATSPRSSTRPPG